MFVEMVRSVEAAVAATVDKVTRDVDDATTDRLADTVRKVFGRVLKELADLDNPMRTPIGSEPGQGGLFADADTIGDGLDGVGLPPDRTDTTDTGSTTPDVSSELSIPTPPEPSIHPAAPARPDRQRKATSLPSIAPDPEPGEARSRFDADNAIVLYSELVLERAHDHRFDLVVADRARCARTRIIRQTIETAFDEALAPLHHRPLAHPTAAAPPS